MQSKKEQFEILSKELLGKLADVSVNSELFFPFGYFMPEEFEEKYFYKGLVMRTITIRNMIVIDNSFKKFQIFPTHDVMKTYIETQKELLADWISEACEEFYKMYDFKEDKKAVELEFEDFKKIIYQIRDGINKLSMSAIKEICSSDEAKALDGEYTGAASGFKDFIHNTISNLFK